MPRFCLRVHEYKRWNDCVPRLLHTNIHTEFDFMTDIAPLFTLHIEHIFYGAPHDLCHCFIYIDFRLNFN